jgi:hypothetical protein
VNAEIWKQCLSNIEKTLAQFEAKGADVYPLEVLPAAPDGQVEEFESKTGLTLPDEFKALMKLAGGFRFDWSLNVSGTDEYLVPPIMNIDYGGSTELPFIGASDEVSLLELYEDFQEHYSGYNVSEPEQVEIIRNSFPLCVWDGDGNALGMRLDTDPVEIHCLEAEGCWRVCSTPRRPVEGSLVGKGLTDFLVQWTAVGSPAINSMLWFLQASGDTAFDANSEGIAPWLDWLADPNATESA